MKSWLLPVVSLVLGISACASMRNTPQQDYVEEMGANCARTGQFMGGTRVVRVAPDGRYWVFAPGEAMVMRDEYPRFFACMKEQYQAHPFLDWLKAQKREAQGPLAAVGSTSVVVSLPPGPITAPVWQVGDEWQYAYQSSRDSGTFVWSVDREEVLDGIPFYVVKSGTSREIYYRKSDFAYYMDKVNGQVETRHTPPTAFIQWPPSAGAKWELRYTRERPLDRQTEEIVLSCEYGIAETVTVPAGTFETMKITCRNARTGAVTYEVWPSMATKQIVRERAFFSYGIRERELISYKLK